MSNDSVDTNYDYITEPDINLICSICHNAFVDPVTTTTCQHTFCKDCILEAIKGQPQCPVDRSALSPAQLRGAGSALQGILDDLKVRCGIAGCGQEYERSMHVAHRATCDEVIVICPNDRCEDEMKRSCLARHLADTCTQRVMNCDVCKETITATNIWRHQHLPSQSDAVISCRFCHQDISRQEVGSHRWNCDKAVVSCPHARHGCWTVTTRGELGAHVKICPYDRVASFMSGLNRRIARLEERMDQSDRLLTSTRSETLANADVIVQLEAMVRPMWRLMQVPATNHEALHQAYSLQAETSRQRSNDRIPQVSSIASAQNDRSAGEVIPHTTYPLPIGRFAIPEVPLLEGGAETTRSRSETELLARPELMRPDISLRFEAIAAARQRLQEELEELANTEPFWRAAYEAIRMAPPTPARDPSQTDIAAGATQQSNEQSRRAMHDDEEATRQSSSVASPDASEISTPALQSEEDYSIVDAPTAGSPSPRVGLDTEVPSAAESNTPRHTPQHPGRRDIGHHSESVLGSPYQVSPIEHGPAASGSQVRSLDFNGRPQRPPLPRSASNRSSHTSNHQPRSFADLAFLHLGYPSAPAQASEPQAVDDQLVELRGIVHRLAEGMDTMERQNQARNVTENLRVQEEVSSLRAIVQVMRNQVMMGAQAPARATATVAPQTPSSVTSADMASPESTPIRESIAFSTQHGDLDGPSETSSISSLITAVNPIRRPRSSMWGRGLGQPMGIPPELDDGAPTVRVEVHTSPSIMVGPESGIRARERSRGQRGQNVLDRLHLRGSRSARNVSQ